MDLRINGQTIKVDAADDTPLLWVIRDELNYTGTKYGCGMSLCGACTVHLDGQPVRSCTLPLKAAEGKSITTIEGLDDKVTQAVRQAWIDNSVPQCGYCQSGQIMSAVALLRAKSQPSNQDIDSALAGNICRCGTYQRIRQAVHQAANALAKG